MLVAESVAVAACCDGGVRVVEPAAVGLGADVFRRSVGDVGGCAAMAAERFTISAGFRLAIRLQIVDLKPTILKAAPLQAGHYISRQG